MLQQKTPHKSLLSKLRPNIENILTVPECLEYFKEFCVAVQIKENLDYILDIDAYLKLDNPLLERFDQLNHLIEMYINTLLLDSDTKEGLSKYLNISLETFLQEYNTIEKTLLAIEDDVLWYLRNRILDFSQSSYWNEFTKNFPHLHSSCLRQVDLQTLKRIRYTKKDFSRDRFSEKEVMLCEFMNDDQHFFHLKKFEEKLAIFTINGEEIMDEEDIGMGKFQGYKVTGYMPYPPWLIILAMASTKFHVDIWDGYRFDRDYDFRHIPANEDDADGHELKLYDSHIAKLVVRFGGLLHYRSCYCLTENLYKGNRTYMINKSITPDNDKYRANFIKGEHFEANETHNSDLTNVDPKIDMTGRTECVHMPLLSLFSIQPDKGGQSMFSYSNFANPGGVLTNIGTPQNRLLKVATSYREKIMGGIGRLLENQGKQLKTMKSVYEMVQTRLNRYKNVSGTTDQHIFEPSFESQLKGLRILK